MPVKRRVAKRRIEAAAELAAWWDVFDTSDDFGGDVAELTGLTEPVFVWPPEARPEAQAAWFAAAREAWARLGAAFLAKWQPPPHRPTPWALDVFGEPPCR